MMLAPMAGGPSTPQLVAAVTVTGSAGFLAGGMITAEQLVEDYRAAVYLRDELTADVEPGTAPEAGVIGVNLFVPEPANTAVGHLHKTTSGRVAQVAALETFRDELAEDADRFGVELPEVSTLDMAPMDDWEAKLEAAVAEKWPVVTFTFGLPERGVFEYLQQAGVVVGVTVTSRAEAKDAVAQGADFLVLQGPDAGGHRSVLDPYAEAEPTDMITLVATVRLEIEHSIPLAYAGGVSSFEQVQRLRSVGADSVVCGTVFLLADEAGTHPVHRVALEQAVETGDTETVVTRAFTGRLARSLTNEFTRRHPEAPASYPQINQLTAPIKKASQQAGDPEFTNLWAGTSVPGVEPKAAVSIARKLLFGRDHT